MQFSHGSSMPGTTWTVRTTSRAAASMTMRLPSPESPMRTRPCAGSTAIPDPASAWTGIRSRTHGSLPSMTASMPDESPDGPSCIT